MAAYSCISTKSAATTRTEMAIPCAGWAAAELAPGLATEGDAPSVAPPTASSATPPVAAPSTALAVTPSATSTTPQPA